MNKQDILKMDLIDITIHLSKVEKQYLDAKTVFNRYERGYKSKLASIIHDYRMNNEGKTSEERLEKLALADPNWKDYLKQWESSEKLMNDLRVTYDTWVNILESMRDMNATKRTEMKIL